MKLSKWAKLWLAWAAIGIAIEIFAAFGEHHKGKPRTFTEFARWLFPKKVRRIILVGLMAVLTWHFWQGEDVKPLPQEVGCERDY